jgi:hypothetical protein
VTSAVREVKQKDVMHLQVHVHDRRAAGDAPRMPCEMGVLDARPLRAPMDAVLRSDLRAVIHARDCFVAARA